MKLYELVNLLDAADVDQLEVARRTARDTMRHLIYADRNEPRIKLYRALIDACDARLDEICEIERETRQARGT